MLTPELIAPERLEALLAGAVPDTHAEARLQGLALELRSGAPTARDELRRRVRALASAPRGRRVLASRPRVVLVLAPLALATVAGSLVLGRVGIGSSGSETAKRGVPGAAALQRAPLHTAGEPLTSNLSLTPFRPTLDADTRARHVDMWIELRVRDADRLSAAANNAMRVTRELGGFVASSTVGTRGNEGRAEISLRVPVGRVDDALFRLSQLGAITGQRVVTEDRQADIDRSSQRIEALRRAIQIAELRLGSGTLTVTQRLQLQIKLARLHGELTSLRRSRARLVREAATADLTLVLHTQAAASGKANKSGVGGIVGDALHLLGRAGAISLFAAIVLSPLVVLALLIWLVRRRRLRRQEAQLLGQARPGVPSPQPPRP